MSWQGWLCLSADAQVLGRQGILQAADLHACVELVAGRGGHVAEDSRAGHRAIIYVHGEWICKRCCEEARTHTARTLRLKEHGLRDGKLRGC